MSSYTIQYPVPDVDDEGQVIKNEDGTDQMTTESVVWILENTEEGWAATVQGEEAPFVLQPYDSRSGTPGYRLPFPDEQAFLDYLLDGYYGGEGEIANG